MKRFVFLATSTCMVLCLEAQELQLPKQCLFAVSGNLVFSAGDFSKPGDKLKEGVALKLQLPSCGVVAWSLESSWLFPYDPNDTWYRVKEYDHDLNALFMGWFTGRRTAFYALTGLNVKRWKGTYTGIGENEITKTVLPAGSELSTIRMGANLGVGFEKKINDFGFTGEMRYRISPDDMNVKLRIIDVSYSIGLKYDIMIHKDKKFRRKLFRLPPNRYDLD